MDRQTKFFNKQYLETRLRELRKIKKKEIFFNIEESDRAFSKSLYINFYIPSSNEKKFKSHTLRISDHALENCVHSQFIVEPNDYLTKKKKAQFTRILELAVKRAKIKQVYKELNKISREIENDGQRDK